MAYELERSETATMAIRRIATEEIDEALADLSGDTDRTAAEAVHDCRKRCKKVRALLDMVRPSLGRRYTRATARVREAARELSGARDAQALADAFAATVDGRTDSALVAPVVAGLHQRADAAAADFDAMTDHVMRASALLTKVHGGIDEWRLSEDGWAAIGPGIVGNYRSGRKELARARTDPTATRLHDWRKRVKGYWYHVRLLHDAAPTVLGPLGAALSDLSDDLGVAHDLAVLDDLLAAHPAEFGGDDPVRHARCLVAERRATLEARAIHRGAVLYVESPRRFDERLRAYWELWQEAE
ncbi:MAG: CHAD domain-containing protein [Actinomycetota bacterium]